MKFLTCLFLCFLSLAAFGADGYLARTNGNIVIGPGGSGGAASQTPWVTNIDGGNFYLTNASGVATTNLTVNGTGENFVNALNVSSNLVASNLTASRLVFGDAGKKLISAAASGAVPVDADGSAALFSQINALASGSIITNGNAANMAFAGAITNSGLTVTGSTAGLIVLGGTDGGLIVLSNSTAIATTQFGSNDYWFMTNTTTAKTVAATNGTITAFAFVGDGSGLTGLPGSAAALTNNDTRNINFLGTFTTTTPTINGYLAAQTNSFTTNTAFPLGFTNLLLVTGANTGAGITGVLNGGTTTERWGQLTIVASGPFVWTNPASIHSSDFVTTRTITNGNTAVISVDVFPGQATNMAIVQFK